MKKLLTRVWRAEAYRYFTRAWLYSSAKHPSITFELPISVQLKPYDRVVFYDCTVRRGRWEYIDNKSYNRLEVYRKGARKPALRLAGKQAEILERLAEKNEELRD